MHPVLFELGSFKIYTYGAFAALAMFWAFLAVARRAGRLGVTKEMAYDLILILFVTGVVGARIFFVLQHLEDYRAHPTEAFLLREGGLVWYGGFITASCAGLCYAHRRRWPLLRLADFLAPIAAWAHAIGRLGCYFNGCCFGRVTGSGLGVVFPGEVLARLPVQLYEACFLVVLALILELILARRPREGTVFLGYLMGYSVVRFGLEFLRGDQIPFGGLTPPQWTSLGLFAGSIFLYHLLRQKGKINGRP